MTFIHDSYTQNRKALGLVVLEKKTFYVIPIVSLWDIMTPGVGPFFDPRDMAGRIYNEDHLTLPHTNYKKIWGLVVSEKKTFFMFFQ